ncbi:hypothetical protein [Streptomyces endophyticus]|uniref:MFS transporter n=1 Tax=Streptomyces endophyticus TaxID=714166 RepID=A0ABU6F6H4_9ACTN|nr:hypothetical protein [Streptomyces endophyticus]MEB8339623.1 hypothetical protein [Streptomyces endophyticus]
MILLISAGAALAPLTICLFALLDAHTPRQAAVASMMWLVAGEELGITAGTLVAGALAQQTGAGLALLTAAAGGGLGALALAIRKADLAPTSKVPAV